METIMARRINKDFENPGRNKPLFYENNYLK